MDIYKLERTDSIDRGQTAGLMISAQSAERARELAHDEARGSQNPRVWFSAFTIVTLVGIATEGLGTGVILTDFNRG